METALKAVRAFTKSLVTILSELNRSILLRTER
jgi:hypothetical protein